jgi:6-phosphogluconolactonase
MTMRVRASLTMIVALAIIGLAGCDHYNCASGPNLGTSCTSTSTGLGTGSTGSPATAFDFFVNGRSVGAASLENSGNFALIPNFTSPELTLNGGVGGVVIVQKQWLYVAQGPQIEAYSIDGTTGALTAVTGSPFATNDTESYSLSTDPAGKFLFLSGANDNQVTVFGVNQTDGSLTTVASFPTGFFAAEATTDGLGKFLYVTAGNLGSVVAVYSIGSTGSLTPISGSPFSISIAQLEAEPTGKFLLGVTGNGANNGFTSDDHIYVFSINQSTGVITPVTGSPFKTTFTPATLTVHPSGTFVYTFNQTVVGTSPTEGFQFNTATGAVTPLSSSPFTSLTAPAGMFDQSGAYLFMHPGTSLSVASVNTTTGALTSIATPITAIGSAVGWAVTDPH